MARRGYISHGKNIFDDMQDTIAGVHKRLDMIIAASKQATMPTYPSLATPNPGDLPDDPIQGQVAISGDDDSVWIYSGGAWRDGWHDAVLINGWGSVGDPYHPGQYSRSLQGKLRFRGAIDGGSPGSIAFYLPESYWPAKNERYVIAHGSTPTVMEVASVDGGVTVFG